MSFAIIDIETTGGSPKYHKITEVAIYIHDGNEIIDEFSTLINPECIIPAHITRLTGITNEMVADSPKFYEIARKIVELTENKIFIAHSVHFDYSFIKSEFERLGYDYRREKLCTVNLSRKYFPGKRSYSLGRICDDLGISINNRHRAAGDALATVKLFEQLLKKGLHESLVHHDKEVFQNLHPALDKATLKAVPEKPGVYFFHNENKDILYIGKSKNMKERVVSHFSNSQTKRALEMKSQIADISYELTGSELVASLMESEEIKQHRPRYNRAQRRSFNNWGLYYFFDQNGYINFRIEKTSSSNVIPLTGFDSQQAAKDKLYFMIEQYELCQKLCGLYHSDSACFHYQIGGCKGACIQKEQAESYNRRAEIAISSFSFDLGKSLFIIDAGRHNTEKSVIKIENGKYIGFGFLDTDCFNFENMHDCIKNQMDNREVQRIIRSYLNRKSVEKIISY